MAASNLRFSIKFYEKKQDSFWLENLYDILYFKGENNHLSSEVPKQEYGRHSD